jgi:NCS1 family nucleobase:cation symporter-1
MAVPMTLHGYAGSRTHVPFAVLARSAFGYHFAKFPVVVRLITCFFWHAITNYLGIGATTQVIRAIWPSYRNIPNHLPASANITTQEMISYFILWTVQFPLLTIPPYKMKWLFMVKSVMIVATILGMVIWVCTQVHGSGSIWSQQANVSGSQKAWLTMWALNSCTASW